MYRIIVRRRTNTQCREQNENIAFSPETLVVDTKLFTLPTYEESVSIKPPTFEDTILAQSTHIEDLPPEYS